MNFYYQARSIQTNLSEWSFSILLLVRILWIFSEACLISTTFREF